MTTIINTAAHLALLATILILAIVLGVLLVAGIQAVFARSV